MRILRPYNNRIFYLIIIVFSILLVFSADLDTDGMNDAWETSVGLNNSNILDAGYDNDSDGLINLWEYRLGFHPFNNDSDSNYTVLNESLNGISDSFEDLDLDGLNNSIEITINTNPLSNDTDSDGLLDGDEIFTYGTNATLNDTDSDSLLDGTEVFIYGTNPLSNDTDSDGILDGDEIFTYFTNATLNDTDSDSLLDGTEVFIYGTNPLSNDTDSDGLLDADEIFTYFTNATLNDTDSDGLLDGIEVLIYGSNPFISNSDFDSYSDFDEVNAGRNPTIGLVNSEDVTYLLIGETITYYVNLTSINETFNSTINFILPNGLVYDSSNNNGSFIVNRVGQNVSFNVGNLSGITRYSFSVSAYLNDTPNNNFTTTIQSAKLNFYYQNRSGNLRIENESSSTIDIYESDVDVNVLRNVSIVNIGSIINFTLDFNVGIFGGYNFSVNTYLGDGLSYSSSSIAPDVINGRNLTFYFDNDSVLPDIQIFAIANSTYDNSSYVLANDNLTVLANFSFYSSANLSRARYYFNSSNSSVILQTPNVVISSIQNNVTIGQIVNYTLLYDFSLAPANLVKSNISLPLNFKYVNYSSSASVTFNDLGSILNFDFDNLSGAQIIELNISYLVNNSANSGDIFTSNVNLSYSSSDSSIFSDTNSLNLICAEPNLSITKSIFSPVSVSDLLTYIITITNNGNTSSQNTTLVETIANGTQAISSIPAFDLKSGTYNETLRFDIASIAPGTSVTVNVTVNITENYFNGLYILSNDTLTFNSNLSYQSVLNLSTSRLYNVITNENTTIQEGAITKSTNGSITINSNPSTRIGENFLYEIVVNFTGAPANTVTITDRLPQNITFVNSNNSLNNSAFTQNGQLLTWNFGNLTPSTKIIYINITAYVNKSSSNIAGISIINNANLTYSNTIGSSILKQDSSIVYVAEPNINITKTLLNTFDVSIGDLINYTINVSNMARPINLYNSRAYNVTLIEHIPDGLILNFSSILPTLQNSTHLMYSLGNLNVNQSSIVNLRFEVNSSYRNSSYVLSEDLFSNYVDVLTYSFSNISTARNYTKNFTSNLIQIDSPTINIYNNATSYSIGDIIKYSAIINFSNAPANNVNVTHLIPNGLNILNISTSSNISFSQNGNILNWGFGNLSSQGIFTINITTRINNSVNIGDILTYNINLTYTSSNHTRFALLDNNAITIIEPSILISETLFSPISTGDTLTYFVNLTNIGNSIAYNTTFIHHIPNGTIINLTSPSYDLKSGANNETFTFYIGSIPNGTSLQFNFTVNITQNYYNNDYVLANDTLFAFTNVTYQSNSNFSYSRFYQNNSIATTTIQEGAIVKDTIGTIIVNAAQAVRIGEIFNYTIFVNFTGAPANTVVVKDRLPAFITFVNTNNSLNESAFIQNGQLLSWTFGDLSPSTKTIRINISTYINNSAGYIAGNTIINNVNLTYSNIQGSSILKQDNSDVEIVESNLHLDDTLLNTIDIIVDDFVNYTINLTNIENDLLNFYSPAFNVSLINYIPDGLILNFSSIAPNTSNSTHLIWNFNTLNLNQSKTIDLHFKVNSTYRNGSYVLSEDTFRNNISVSSMSVNNWSSSKKYLLYNLSNFIQVDSPQINIILNQTNTTIGKEIKAQILLNFTNSLSNFVNMSLLIPNGLEYVNSQVIDNISFSQSASSLVWEFGNLTTMKFYPINITFITNNSLNLADTVFILSNLSYTSTNGSVFFQNDIDSFNITEPNISIYIYDISAKEVSDNVTYTINVTNIGNSIAYNVTLWTNLANGTSFISSNPIQDNQTGTYNNLIKHQLGNINIGETIQINTSTLVLENYTDGSDLLTGDILWSFFNLSYLSSNNINFARSYFNETNKSFSIANPELTVTINNSLIINNLSAISVGELFDYNIVINFTDRYSTKAFIQNILPSNLTFISQNNSLNNSAFSNIGNNLQWNFTSINSSTEVISINVSVYATNISSNIFGTNLQSYYNLTYENSMAQQINKEMLYDILLSEPNINMNISANVTFASLLDIVNYTITISNQNRATNFTSKAYNLSLIHYLADGVTYISSNYPLINGNLRNLSFNFTSINVDEIIEINIIARINNTLLNGSANNLSNVTNNVYLDSFSAANLPTSRRYINTSNANVILHDITSPIINMNTIVPKGVAITQDVRLLMNASDEIELDNCWVNILYPNSTSVNLSNACIGINFTTPNLQGKYNVTFYANDTSNNIANTTNYFRVGPPLIFNTSITNNNLSGLNTSIKIFIEGTDVLSASNNSGNFSNTISTFIYDILFKAFNNTFFVRLNSVNASNNNNKIIRLDRNTNISDALVVYGVLNGNYSFLNASVTISYANTSFSNENYLVSQVCENWNFTARICYSGWVDIIGATQDITLNTFNFTRNSFSGFRIVEVIPPSSGGGSSSSSSPKTSMNFTMQQEEITNKCLEDWICINWEPCKNGIQQRKCFDNNDCGTFFNMPIREQSCQVNNSDNEIIEQNIIEQTFEKPLKVIQHTATFFEKIIKSSKTLAIVYLFLIILSFKMKHRIDDRLSREKVRARKHILPYYGEHFDVHQKAWEMFMIGLLIVIFTSTVFVVISGWYIGLVFGIFCEITYVFYLHNHYNTI